MKRPLRAAAFLLLLLVLCRCSSYASRVRDARYAFEIGNYDTAATLLEKLAEKADNDELLYWMDLGLVYHTAGKYTQAITAFQKADKLGEIKDYTSLSTEAATVLFNDNIKTYKGEDFEKILVNVYLALDYALLGQWESSLVECRRVNHKLDLMISKGKLPYERNAFAKYLAGTLFEAQGEYNDAFVDYRQLQKWGREFDYLKMSLLRLATVMNTEQELMEYKKKYPGVTDYLVKRGEGEIIVILEEGRAPIKVPSIEWRRIPTFRRRVTLTRGAQVRVAGKTKPTESIFDIEETAIRELNHRKGLILAKKIGGVVLKEVIAHQVAKQTKSELLGALTSIFLHATDEPDLRSWTTLPARLQIARITVPAGKHDVALDLITTGHQTKPSQKKWTGVEVKSGQRVFLNYRTIY